MLTNWSKIKISNFRLLCSLGLREKVSYLIYLAFNIAKSIHSQMKIKQIGDMCLKSGDIEMAIECFEVAEDLNSLLLVYSSLSLPDQLAELG